MANKMVSQTFFKKLKFLIHMVDRWGGLLLKPCLIFLVEARNLLLTRDVITCSTVAGSDCSLLTKMKIITTLRNVVDL